MVSLSSGTSVRTSTTSASMRPAAAKATIAGWCRGIELTPEQRRAIVERTGSRAGVPVDTQHRRRLEIERIRFQDRMTVDFEIPDAALEAALSAHHAVAGAGLMLAAG